jgi:hypothetical protein
MTTLRVPREQARTVLVGRIQAGEELATTQADIAESAGGWRDWLYLFSTWREHTTAELKAVYESEDEPRGFDAVTQTTDRSSPQYTFPYSKSALDYGLSTLRSLVERLPLAVEPQALQARPENDQTPREHGASPGGRKVFVIHGRAAGGFREAAARFIEHLGLSAVILAEQVIGGRTIIENLEANAIDVGYAIVLLTPEDRAYGPDDEPPPRTNRARQNVILELGYFMAKLGRKMLPLLCKKVLSCQPTSSVSSTSHSMTVARGRLCSPESCRKRVMTSTQQGSSTKTRLNKRAPTGQRAGHGARRRTTGLARPPSRRRDRGFEARHPDMARGWSRLRLRMERCVQCSISSSSTRANATAPPADRQHPANPAQY